MPKPKKEENVIELVRKCIETDKYTITTHALSRQSERKISVAEVVHVLKTGYEEKEKLALMTKVTHGNMRLREKQRLVN